MGHHTHQDGVSMFQSMFQISDEPEKREYPFLRRKSPGFLQWCMIFLTIPISWPLTLTHYESRPIDKNCIKKFGQFMSGKLNVGHSQVISMSKIKKLGKEMGLTFNDVIMGIVSASMKRYFNQKEDKSKEISVAIPFSFNSIPEDMRNYKFRNSFASMTLYMPLEANFTKACSLLK